MRENNLNIFRNRRLQPPTPELYVVYNGKEKLTETTISIANNIGEHKNFNFKLNVIDINFNVLPDKASDNYLAGYSCLVEKIRNYEAEKYMLDEAIELARNDCLQLGYLKDYLNREEFINMLKHVYTIEQEIEDSRLDGIEEGIEKGIKEGVEITKKGIALKMLYKNNSFETISEITELDVEEIRKIKESLDKEHQ